MDTNSRMRKAKAFHALSVTWHAPGTESSYFIYALVAQLFPGCFLIAAAASAAAAAFAASGAYASVLFLVISC